MKFRKKPVVIEAMLWDGTVETGREIALWAVDGPVYWTSDLRFSVRTLEGEMSVSVGDWIIRGVKGEYYPCKPDIFEATYEKVAE